MYSEDFKRIGEYAAAGAYEEPERSLFYRKSLMIRRYYENCKLYPYNGKPLYPSGTCNQSMHIVPHYLKGYAIFPGGADEEAKKLFGMFESDFGKFRSKVPSEHTVAGDMFCHSIPHYGRIMCEGLDSYIPRIEKIADRDMREGLLHICEGVRCYVGRCVEYLESADADSRLIEALRRVPFGKAENIYEATVSMNFVMYLDNCDNLGCAARDLYPFFKGEDITDLLENLFSNLDENGGYSMSLGTDYNELTLQCLNAARGKRRPMIELFVDDSTPGEVWDTAFSLMRTHGGQPAFYSPKLIEKLHERLGVREEDLGRFCGGGCTESMFAGLSAVGSLDAGINLPLILEKTIYERLSSAGSFEDFYRAFTSDVRAVADRVTDGISLSQKERAEVCPVPMRTLLVDDCIDNGRDFYAGGARYSWSIVNFAGTVNVIDSMLAVRELVFDDKKYSAVDFCKKLRENDADFLKECRTAKKVFGVDDAEVNAFAERLTGDIFSTLDGKVPYIGTGFIAASIQFRSQVDAGKKVGATPDGRGCGTPLCDSLGAIFGKDKKGPTALLNSVASMRLDKLIGTPILNFNIDESWNDDILKNLILTYMDMGGLQMQITCISAELLMEAYRHPELHGNLVVRVGGYSEYFCRLSDELKKMIIQRTIQSMN